RKPTSGRCGMSHRRIRTAVVIAAVGALVGSGPASAALQVQTYVSPSTGSDANDCSRHSPCLTLQRALNQAVAHGTVTVLDSGNLGIAATITKAVRIAVPAGIDAGLVRAAGTLLTVKAGASDVVTINGISLD